MKLYEANSNFSAVSSSFLTIFIPIFETIIEIGILLFGSFTTFMWLTSGEKSYEIDYIDEPVYNSTSIKNFTENPLVGRACYPNNFTDICDDHCENLKCSLYLKLPKYFHFHVVFSLFESYWILSYISGCIQMVLAGTFAAWYFTFNKDDVPSNTLKSSFYRTFR